MIDAREWDTDGEHRVGLGPAITLDVVETWEDHRDLLWRWRYRGADGTVLPANRSYPTRSQAAEAAGIAYPGVLIQDRAEPIPAARARRRTWVVAALVAVGVLTAGGAVAGAAIAAAAALGWKRIRSALRGLRRG